MLKWISSYPYPLVSIAITNECNIKTWYNCAGDEENLSSCGTFHSSIRLAEHRGTEYFFAEGERKR